MAWFSGVHKLLGGLSKFLGGCVSSYGTALTKIAPVIQMSKSSGADLIIVVHRQSFNVSRLSVD